MKTTFKAHQVAKYNPILIFWAACSSDNSMLISSGLDLSASYALQTVTGFSCWVFLENEKLSIEEMWSAFCEILSKLRPFCEFWIMGSGENFKALNDECFLGIGLVKEVKANFESFNEDIIVLFMFQDL